MSFVQGWSLRECEWDAIIFRQYYHPQRFSNWDRLHKKQQTTWVCTSRSTPLDTKAHTLQLARQEVIKGMWCVPSGWYSPKSKNGYIFFFLQRDRSNEICDGKPEEWLIKIMKSNNTIGGNWMRETGGRMDNQSQQIDIPLVKLDVFQFDFTEPSSFGRLQLCECSCAILVCHPLP